MEFNVPETLHRAIRKAIAITHNICIKTIVFYLNK